MADPGKPPANENVCPSCGERFVCGLDAGEKVCWCAQLPVLAEPPAPALGCLCPVCLRKKLASSHPDRA
jgi:hypothetical protein